MTIVGYLIPSDNKIDTDVHACVACLQSIYANEDLVQINREAFKNSPFNIDDKDEHGLPMYMMTAKICEPVRQLHKADNIDAVCFGCLSFIDEEASRAKPMTDEDYRRAATEEYCLDENTEVDSDAEIIRIEDSNEEGKEIGAWIAAWVYVER